MLGGLFQAGAWALGIFWKDPNSELLFSATSKAHIIFEIFMVWQQFHAHSESSFYIEEEVPTLRQDVDWYWPQPSVNIAVAHSIGVVLASGAQKYISGYYSADDVEVVAEPVDETPVEDTYATAL